MATSLILIRHGQTDWNLKKRYCGFVDLSLNQIGKKQAEGLRKRFKKEKVDKVYSSDKKRAVQSAEIIFKGREIEKIEDLREIHFGVFEGFTHKEVMEKYPEIYRRWLKDPFSVVIPGGEGLQNFKKRIIKAFKKIVTLNKGKAAAVVCHGGPISIFINHILKSKDFWGKIPSSASVSIIEFKNGKPRIELFNDIEK